MAAPELSVVMVAGGCRERAQHSLDCLCAQSALDLMEIVVVDVAPPTMKPFVVGAPAAAAVEIVSRPGLESWPEARRTGVERTTAPAIAFVEEHCFTDPEWAAAVIEAHRGPWASVGYAFRNANPESYVSRAGMLTDFGLWLDPAPRGPTTRLPGHNVSYKREALLSLGDAYEHALGSDLIAYEEFRLRGLPMFVENRALAAHQNFQTVWGTGRSNYVGCRALAARRAHVRGWSRPRRLIQAIGTPVAAPIYRMARLIRSLDNRPQLWRPLLLGLPLILLVSVWAGLGEAVGYLRRPGTTDASLKLWELDAERVPHHGGNSRSPP